MDQLMVIAVILAITYVLKDRVSIFGTFWNSVSNITSKAGEKQLPTRAELVQSWEDLLEKTKDNPTLNEQVQSLGSSLLAKVKTQNEKKDDQTTEI